MSLSYTEAKQALIAGLLQAASEQEAGHLTGIETSYHIIDDELPRDEWQECYKLLIALRFWGGWIDARNRGWQYYDGIQGRDWPRLARSILADLEADREISNKTVLKQFDFRNRIKRRKPPTPKPRWLKISTEIFMWVLAIGVVAAFLGYIISQSPAIDKYQRGFSGQIVCKYTTSTETQLGSMFYRHLELEEKAGRHEKFIVSEDIYQRAELGMWVEVSSSGIRLQPPANKISAR